MLLVTSFRLFGVEVADELQTHMDVMKSQVKNDETMTCLFVVGFDENCNAEEHSAVSLFITEVLLVFCGEDVELCMGCDGKLKSTDPNELAAGGCRNAGITGFNSIGCGKMI